MKKILPDQIVSSEGRIREWDYCRRL